MHEIISAVYIATRDCNEIYTDLSNVWLIHNPEVIKHEQHILKCIRNVINLSKGVMQN